VLRRLVREDALTESDTALAEGQLAGLVREGFVVPVV
jgi:hypothetical protein